MVKAIERGDKIEIRGSGTFRNAATTRRPDSSIGTETYAKQKPVNSHHQTVPPPPERPLGSATVAFRL
jgi:hypothetical protein